MPAAGTSISFVGDIPRQRAARALQSMLPPGPVAGSGQARRLSQGTPVNLPPPPGCQGQRQGRKPSAARIRW